MMSNIVYTTAIDDNAMYYIDGPCDGGECTYYGGFLYPKSRFSTKENAEKSTKLMNMAYREGYAAAQHNIRKALGIAK